MTTSSVVQCAPGGGLGSGTAGATLACGLASPARRRNSLRARRNTTAELGSCLPRGTSQGRPMNLMFSFSAQLAKLCHEWPGSVPGRRAVSRTAVGP